MKLSPDNSLGNSFFSHYYFFIVNYSDETVDLYYFETICY